MKVIFICTGNTCRSPIAEGYLKTKNIKGLTVLSRGIFADGSAVSRNSDLVAKELGFDISGHISSPLTSFDLDADKFICMSKSHTEALASAGITSDKLYLLGDGIPDPFGGDMFTYRRCADEIVYAIDALLKKGFFDEIIIRKAELSDIPQIALIEKECFSTPWSENAIEESMNSKTLFLMAEVGGKAAGYIGISCVCGEGYITNVAVKENFRRMGVGSKIIKETLRLAKEEKLEFVSLEVRKSNDKAIGLYKKYGFSQVGVRKNFYTKPDEDAIIMTRRF